MNKHEIIEQLAKDKIVEGIVDNINNKDPDLEDLKQDIYVELLLKDDRLIEQLHEDNKLRYFITKMVTNNIKSKTSPYYYQYKKSREKLDYYGEIVECGDREQLLKYAKTEYTRQLLDAVPSLGGMRYV